MVELERRPRWESDVEARESGIPDGAWVLLGESGKAWSLRSTSRSRASAGGEREGGDVRVGFFMFVEDMKC